MISKSFKLSNDDGLNIQNAQVLVNAMSKYISSVIISLNGDEVNAKSIISLMVAKIESGTELIVECSGRDEKEAMAEVSRLFENGFVL